MSSNRIEQAADSNITEDTTRRCDDCDVILENEIELLTGVCDDCRGYTEDGCPICANEHIYKHRSYEDSDADGNRGRWAVTIHCELCVYDGGYYE